MPEQMKSKKPTRDSVATEQPGDRDQAPQSTKDIKGPSALPNPDTDEDSPEPSRRKSSKPTN